MKKIGIVVLFLIILGALAVQYFVLDKVQQSQRAQMLELTNVKNELNKIKNDSAALKQELDKLRRREVGVIAKNAREALMAGWNSMMDALEKETQSAETSLTEPQAEQGKTNPVNTDSSTQDKQMENTGH